MLLLLVPSFLEEAYADHDTDLKFKSVDDDVYDPDGDGYIRGEDTFRVVADIENDSSNSESEILK